MADDISGLYKESDRLLEQIKRARGLDELCEYLMSKLQQHGGWAFIYEDEDDDDDFHQPITEH